MGRAEEEEEERETASGGTKIGAVLSKEAKGRQRGGVMYGGAR